MANTRCTKIRIRMHEVTIIRFRTGDDKADASAYEQRVIQDDESDVTGTPSESPDAKLFEQSDESTE